MVSGGKIKAKDEPLGLQLPGRATMLRHVLWAIPTYHLLLVSLNGTGYKEMEQISRNFLWGTSRTGVNKKALIS